MPNRLIREGINSSARINALSPGAEILYRRLMSVADDYGRYYAAPATVRGACWPTCPEKVCEADVKQWISECAQVHSNCLADASQNGLGPLLLLYESGGCQYLQITDFRQQTRSRSKFPDPDINCLASAEQVLSTTRARTSTSSTTKETSTPSAGIQISNGKHELSAEGFQRFDDLCAKAGISRAPSDLKRAKLAWRVLDFEQRLAAVQGMQARIDVGEYEPSSGFLPLAHNYLDRHLWDRPVRDKRKKPAVPESNAYEWPEMDDSWKQESK